MSNPEDPFATPSSPNFTPPPQPGQPNQAGLPPYPGHQMPNQPGMMPYGAPMAPGMPYQMLIPPKEPQATTAMWLGIVGLVGWFCFPILGFLSPVAWIIGHKSLKAIRLSNGTLSGDSEARTGMVTGIIGSVILVIVILILVAFVLGLSLFG